MKILLINVSLRPESKTLMPPVGLGFIASAIDRAGYALEILDVDAHRYSEIEVEKMLSEKEYDIAAMGCIVTGYKIVKKYAELIKKYNPNVPIIVGNSVASSIPELILNKTLVDIAVIGEGDITIVELLDAISNKMGFSGINGIYYKENNKVIKNQKRETIKDINTIPFVNWGLFDFEIYLKKSKYYLNEPYPLPFDKLISTPINTARGCAFRCTFCYHVFKEDKYRVKTPEIIVEEMMLHKEKYNANYINFFDELTFFSKQQCEEFVELLLDKNLNLFWTASCRGNLFNKQAIKLAKDLKRSGCVGLGYSLESANLVILKAMNKKMKPEEFVQQTKVLQEAGIATWTSIVLGYPQESEQSIKETFDCCYDADIYPSSGYLLPMPGTLMYDYAKEIGAINDDEEYLLNIGDRQDFRINLTNLNREAIEELVKQHLKRISDKLSLNLDESQLIKTGHYKSKDKIFEQE